MIGRDKFSNDCCDDEYLNDYCEDEFIVYSPYIFKNKLSSEDYSKIKPMFCIKSLDSSGIVSVRMRPLELLKSSALYLGLKSTTVSNENLKNLDVAVVRRFKDKNGNKIDKMCVVKGKIISICNPCCNCNTSILINGEFINPRRIFLLCH